MTCYSQLHAIQSPMSHGLRVLPRRPPPVLECLQSPELGASSPPVLGPILIGTGILLNFLKCFTGEPPNTKGE